MESTAKAVYPLDQRHSMVGMSWTVSATSHRGELAPMARLMVEWDADDLLSDRQMDRLQEIAYRAWIEFLEGL